MIAAGRDLRFFELQPNPCGHIHRSLSAIYECAVAHPEVVGFSLVEVLRPGERRSV